ncbi:DUF2155 domain-containing protein [Maricaulis sp.]|uniref:DUF2155 domain-containing protein n=1 Tax=Maricaulis sp. TaxID=1486257 RepID=UPI0025C0999E|nr:DUF2155 domain-containing protein [Maricaulis sp.]
MKTCVFASIVSLALAAPLLAQDERPDGDQPVAPSAQDASNLLRRDDPDAMPERGPLSSQPGTTVVLRGLDKVTARTRDFEIAIGDTVEFGALSITAQYCRKRPPEETPETYAFLQINDRRTDGFGVDVDGEQIFSGWMFASRPAQNPLEHPVYDVWVIDCRA